MIRQVRMFGDRFNSLFISGEIGPRPLRALPIMVGDCVLGKPCGKISLPDPTCLPAYLLACEEAVASGKRNSNAFANIVYDASMTGPDLRRSL